MSVKKKEYNTASICVDKELYKIFMTTVTFCSSGETIKDIVEVYIRDYIEMNKETTEERLKKFWDVDRKKSKSKRVVKKK